MLHHSSPNATAGPQEAEGNYFPKDYLSTFNKILSEQAEEYKELYFIGQQNLKILMAEYRDPTRWTLSKVNKDTTLFTRNNPDLHGAKGASCFKAEAEIDCAPSILIIYYKDFEKRKLWDEDTDHLKVVQDLPMNTMLIHIKMKPHWPLGARESLLLYHGYKESETGNIYNAGASIAHPSVPLDPTGKLIRVHCYNQHSVFESIDGGTRTKMIYIVEFNFGGNVPAKIVQNMAMEKYSAKMTKLKKLVLKEKGTW